MEHILIISGSPGAAGSLETFVRESFRCQAKTVESAYQAKNAFSDNPYVDLALINAPLPDESGVELAKYVTQHTPANCILLIRQETAESLADLTDRYNIITVGKPLNRALLYQLMRTIDIAVRRSNAVYEENRKLEQKIKDIQTVDRAKFMMMEYKGMTEAEAHAYLEKYAMNKRKKKAIAALEIIDRINEQYL